MTRLHFNTLAWPLFIIAALLLTLSNGEYILHEEINDVLFWTAVTCWGGSTYALIVRLRETRVSPWFVLLIFLPLAQLILMLLASFLPNRESA